MSTETELRRKYKSNEIIVNNKSNFKSHLTKCQSIIDDTKFDKLVIRGMGKATTRVLNLAFQLNNNNFNAFDLCPRTYSVDKMDNRARYRRILKGAEKEGFDPDNLDPGVTRKLVHIPAVEVTVWKNKLEIDRKGRKHN